MSETMIERVAKAIAESALGDDEGWMAWIDEAKAAIKAMRKPTPKMVRAACKALSPECRPTMKRVSVKAKHGIRYRAMIDTALSEAEGERE